MNIQLVETSHFYQHVLKDNHDDKVPLFIVNNAYSPCSRIWLVDGFRRKEMQAL